MQKALPSNWKTKKLGEVVKNDKFAIVDGPFGTQLHAKDYTEIGIPVIRIINITRDNKFNDHNLVFISEQKFKSLTRSAVFPGDILLAKTGATIGKVAIFDNYEKALIASSCAKISINPDIANNKFVLYYLSTQKGQTQIIGGSSGSTRNSINLKEIANVKIPLLPLPTQHKIVDILEEADNLRKLRQQADDRMKDLILSLFVQMFGDPVTNPKGWEVKKLEEVCDIKSGGTPSRNIKEYWGGNIPWLGSTVCKDMPVYTAEEFITITGLEKSAAKIFKPKTTLIALVGATIGRTAFLTFEAATNQNIAGLYPLNSNILIPEFIFYFSQTLYNEFLKLGEENFRMANLSFIRGLKIPLPPLSLQQEFAERVEEIEAEKVRQAESRKKLNELFQSLMQRAFIGELVA